MQEVAFDTAKTLLIPVELYEEGAAEHYLNFNGMGVATDEVVVVSRPRNDIVAVMAVPTERWNEFRERYERGEVEVTSPLLFAATRRRERPKRREVWVDLTDENVYLTVWDGELKMAEAMPDNSVDSLLYYIQVVGRRFNLRKFEIIVGGPRAGLVADALRQYYKKVQSER
jgi:hypothetical protein